MATDRWSVDLHSHTLFSDGSLTPTQLVRLAMTNGVRALSITDHDHTGGIDEALRAGATAGVEVIPGIELSASYAEFEDIHILAYYFAWRDPHLRARLETFRLARETRAERILERINAKLAGEGREPIAYRAVKAQVQGAFGRPHIATALIDQGYVPDIHTAFKDYLIPCNVPKYYMPADEAVALIRRARGLSSVAHPRFMTADRVRLRQVILELRGLGLDGVEAYHSDHSAEDRLYFIRLANQLGMLITGGSDYHGFKARSLPPDNGGKLGSLQLPYGFAVRLRRAYLNVYPMILLLFQWPAAGAASIRRAFEAHYQLSSVGRSHSTDLAPMLGRVPLARGSLVIDCPVAGGKQVDALIAESRERGMRVVGVPWETANIEGRDGFYQTRCIALDRVQRTPVERLAHELVHEAILAQLC
ncbi:MAG TPA: PHP domain-containing protein [Candidatus Tectomicrobia bacterium]|nr:PHP domain-containing protein [Candidatus Tectomicrobia bacterium]